jgi:N-acetylmuramoyl-L-alanine amidase
MGSRYLTDLATVCRNAGLLVQEEPGWQSRARSSGGYNSGLPNHVMIHHTASGPSSDGQPDVSYMCYSADARPVANLYIARNGKVWVMAAGATNTNGSGHDPCGATPDDSMNSNAIGIEAGNNGTGEPWPDAQQRAYTTMVKALCKHYGIQTGRVHSHAEWAPSRKVDPAGPSRWASSGTWNEDAFRSDVATGWPGSPPPQEDDDDMKGWITSVGGSSFYIPPDWSCRVPLHNNAEVNAFKAAGAIASEDINEDSVRMLPVRGV